MKKSILTFVCSLLVIALLGFTVWHGVDLGFTQIPSITDTENGVRLGLDLVGGSIITFEGMARTVCDYIAGMTDKYAIYKYSEIFIPTAWQVR